MISGRFLLAFVVSSLAHSLAAHASLIWEKDYLMVASAPGEGKAIGRFAFTNTGNYPVKITSFKTGCGCTAATTEKRLVAPGEKGEVVVTYSTAGRRGLREAPVLVKTDDPSIPESTLRFRVLVEQVLEMQPTFLMWTAEEPSTPKKISVKVTDGFPVKEVRALSPEGGLQIRLETIKSGHDYNIWVTPPPQPAALKAKIEVSSDYPSEKVKPLIAHIRVR